MSAFFSRALRMRWPSPGARGRAPTILDARMRSRCFFARPAASVADAEGREQAVRNAACPCMLSRLDHPPEGRRAVVRLLRRHVGQRPGARRSPSRWRRVVQDHVVLVPRRKLLRLKSRRPPCAKALRAAPPNSPNTSGVTRFPCPGPIRPGKTACHRGSRAPRPRQAETSVSASTHIAPCTSKRPRAIQAFISSSQAR